MSISAHRWMMTAAGEPLARADFEAAPGDGEVVVEKRPLAEINAAFDDVHAGLAKRRVVLVPAG